MSNSKQNQEKSTVSSELKPLLAELSAKWEKQAANIVRRAAEKDEFLAGYLCAVQNLAIGFGMDCTAEQLLQESGYSLAAVLKAQKENGFETRCMNKIIRSALQD